MNDIKDLPPYRAVEAGSAIQNQQWLTKAMQVFDTYQATFPVAFFFIC